MKLLKKLGWAVGFVLIVIGAMRLRFDAEILNVLPNKIEAVEGLKLFQERFSSGQELMITIEAASAETAEASAERVAAVLRAETNLVANVLWRAPWLDHPEEAAKLAAYLWFNQLPEMFSTLSNRLSIATAAETLKAAKDELATSFSPGEIAMRAYDPFSLLQLPPALTQASGFNASEQFFASSDGKFRVITVEPKRLLANYRECRAWYASIKRIVEQQNERQGVSVHFTGRPAFVSEISTGMQQDLAGTSAGTLLVIGILFYLTHRRIVPLLWLLFLLVVTLGLSMAFGGLVLGMVNVVSIGFASILVGLGEDFAIVLYQEAQSHPDHGLSEVRRDAALGILWSAITAAGAFAALNLSSLPGLGQLGSFVAIGLLVAAAVMLLWYLPPLAYALRKRNSSPHPSNQRFLLFETRRLAPSWVIWTATVSALCISVALPLFGLQHFDRSPDPLRPKKSEAYETMAAIKQRLGHAEEPLWVVVRGKDEAEVSRRLFLLKQHLNENPAIGKFAVPDMLWPNPANQNANRPLVRQLLDREPILESIAIKEGFTTNALASTKAMFSVWRTAGQQTNVYWPNGVLAQWVLNKVAGHSAGEKFALALIYPKDNAAVESLVQGWPADFRRDGILLSGWQLLGARVFEVVLNELPRVTIPIFLLVVVCLWLAFRDIREVFLSLMTLAFSMIVLNGVMCLLGWKWNMLNLMALPMLLGMGVDFSIHIQLALRKANGDLLQVRRSVGKALLLAGATTVAGFGSLAFASNAGIASLGKTCALGIVVALVTAVYLVPLWWQKMHRICIISPLHFTQRSNS